MNQTETPPKDQGYTSPDFLTNLFKKPLYSPSSLSTLHSTHSFQEHCISPNKQNEVSSLRDIESLEPLRFRPSLNKVYRSSTLVDEQRIYSKKYKIFFKTLLHQRMPEDQLDSIWRKFQQALKNPYAFDKLIDNVKEKRQKQIEEEKRKNEIIRNENQIKNQEKKKKRMSLEQSKFSQSKNIRFSSPQRAKEQEKTQSFIENIINQQKENIIRQSIKKEAHEIKSILLRGIHCFKQRK